MKRTPRLMVLAVFAVSVAMMAGSAVAQPGGGRGRGGPGGGPGFGMRGPGGGSGGVMGLLRSEAVRAEVGVDDATAEKVRDVAMEAMQAGRDAFQRPSDDLSEDERRARFEEMRAQMQQRMKELEKKIAEVIGMEKFGRLKEIELQMAGVEAVNRDEVANFLGLSEEQKEKISAIFEKNREESRAKMQELMPGGFGAMRDMDENARREMFEKMRTAREESQKELQASVKAVLTDEQKEKLGKMMGKPFAKMEEAQEQLRAGGFGGPGGRGGDRGEGGEGGDRGDRGRRGDGERRQRPT